MGKPSFSSSPGAETFNFLIFFHFLHSNQSRDYEGMHKNSRQHAVVAVTGSDIRDVPESHHKGVIDYLLRNI